MTRPASPTPRRSVFAVWRWKWWVWAALVALMPVAYMLSAPVAYYIVTSPMCYNMPYWAADAINQFYEPAWACAGFSETVERIYRWEMDALNDLFGSYGA